MAFSEQVGKAMQKMHERKNVGKIILSPMKEPEPEPTPPPAAAAAAEPAKEGVCRKRTSVICSNKVVACRTGVIFLRFAGEHEGKHDWHETSAERESRATGLGHEKNNACMHTIVCALPPPVTPQLPTNRSTWSWSAGTCQH